MTTAGIEVPFTPISMQFIRDMEEGIKQEFLENGKPVNPPMYKVETVNGGEEWHEHNETTIETDEEKRLWLDYIKAKDELTKFTNDERSKYIMLEGVLLDPPENDEWLKKYKRWHVKNIPDVTDREGLKIFWLMRELFKTPEDVMSITSEIMKSSMSGVDPEDIKKMEDSFRSAMRAPTSNESITPTSSGGETNMESITEVQ